MMNVIQIISYFDVEFEFMDLFRWFRKSNRLRSQTKSESMIRRVVASFPMHTMEIERAFGV
jgi:hypothetical protein